MSGHAGTSLLLLCLIGSACRVAVGSRPDASWLVLPGTRLPATANGDGEALEPLARRLALALTDARFRGRLHGALARHAAPLLPLDRLLPKSTGIVISIPVAAHRRAWLDRPAGPLLIAVASSGVPVAFDLRGGRHRLDPTRPPQTPVIVLGLAEPASASARPAPPPRTPQSEADGGSRPGVQPGPPSP